MKTKAPPLAGGILGLGSAPAALAAVLTAPHFPWPIELPAWTWENLSLSLVVGMLTGIYMTLGREALEAIMSAIARRRAAS